MSDNPPTVRPYLSDMLAYAEEAVSYVEERDGDALAAERMRYLSVIRCVEVVGEAAGRIPSAIRHL
jgi:uncharacterized protein with HEPN domain